MALISLGNPLSDISGSLGGSVFTRDTSGLHLLSLARRVGRRTPLQDRRRRAFQIAKNGWHTTVKAGNAELWKLYAGRHPSKNRLGDTITLTGYQMFMHFNIYRAYNNVSLISTPPEG